jgi:DNA polymerase I-like protein with 3'-5' exonuclease and polymerase domains
MEAEGTSYEYMKPVKQEVRKTLSKEQKQEIKEKKQFAKQIIESETQRIFDREKKKIHIDLEVKQVEADMFQVLLGKILKEIPIVGHNLKFDTKWMHEHDVCSLDDVIVKDDTMIMGYMIFNKQFGTNLKLQTLVERYFNTTWKDASQDWIRMYPQIVDRHFGNIPTGILGEYAAKDAYWNMRLYEQLKSEMPEESNYITEIVNSATHVFSKIEMSGLAVDWEIHDYLKACYERVCDEYLAEMKTMPIVQAYLHEHEGEFNPNSSDQLREILFEEKYYGLPVIKLKKFFTNKKARTFDVKTNKLCTDKNVIAFFLKMFDEMENDLFNDKIANKPPKDYLFVSAHIDHKEAEGNLDIMYSRWEECFKFLKQYQMFKRIGGKLLPTYINPVREMSPNGLYRPNYTLIGTNTGRAASGFHTMDQGSEITRMYTSRWKDIGGLVLAPDYSQIEVRIVASLAGETALLEAYTKGYDIHATTAAKTYKIPIEDVTHEQRQHGKTLNFFTIYGGGPEALADELKIPLEEAKTILTNFFAGYPRLKAWADKQKSDLIENKFILTKWGRKIPVPDIDSKNKGIQSHALRAATNYPVQSAASDCVLYSLVEIDKELRRRNMKSILIGSVHDSIEVDVYPGEIFQVVQIFREVCEYDVQAKHPWILCPLAISIELGANWGSAIEFEIESIDYNSISLIGSGMKRDIESIKNIAERKYKVDLSVIESESLSENDFSPEHFYRDTEKWKAKLVLES